MVNKIDKNLIKEKKLTIFFIKFYFNYLFINFFF